MKLQNIPSISTIVLVFLALFVPTTYVAIKTVFLVIAILGSIFLLKADYRLDSQTLYALAIVASFGFLNSVHGFLNNTPGGIRVLTIMSLWPLLYAFLSINLNRSNSLFILNKTLWFSLTCVVSYSFLFLGKQIDVVPDFLYIALDQGQDVNDDFTEYNMYSIASLLFLVPFAIHQTYLMIKLSNLKLSVGILIAASSILVFLTGRRAVLLILLISPFLIILSQRILEPKECNQFKIKKYHGLKQKIIFILILVFSCVTFKLDIDWNAVWGNFLDGFDFDYGNSTSERVEQFNSLMTSWLNGNIMFGAGNGAATDVVRSYEFPWAYELTYVYLLFSNGIMGVLFYFSWFGWGLLRLRNAIKLNPQSFYYIAPIVTGVFGLATGAASNPYFGKFDYLWVIMLPHLIAGCVKYQKIKR